MKDPEPWTEKKALSATFPQTERPPVLPRLPILICLAGLLFLPHAAIQAQDPGSLDSPVASDRLPASPPVPLPYAARQMDLVKQLAEADGGELWGKSLAGPLLLVDPSTRFAVANQAGPTGRFQQQGTVWAALLPEETLMANYSLELDGIRWTMVRWDALPLSQYDRARLLMHESFHRLQHERDFPRSSPTNAHLDSREGRTWLRMEMRALQCAMRESGQAQERAVRDALQFRAYRQWKCGPTAAAEEMALEANEGLAEYTGFRLCGLPMEQINPEIAAVLQAKENETHYARSFAYATGPALYRLLDRWEPDWRNASRARTVAAQRLTECLELATPLTVDQIQTLGQRYDLEEVILSEQWREQQRQARRDSLEKLFLDGPVLEIETSSQFQYTFNPNQVSPLTNTATVYQPFQGSDTWGTLEAPDGALLDFSAPMTLRVPYTDDPTWRLKLNEGYRVRPAGDRRWIIQKIGP